MRFLDGGGFLRLVGRCGGGSTAAARCGETLEDEGKEDEDGGEEAGDGDGDDWSD